ncbi:MAG: hypothetical protein Q7J82_08590 [Coriobacteriia bacterium]|nr:hypothetical protein [Coriobacteriia bacterium]
MVQLCMVSETTRPDLVGILSVLETCARARGVGRDAVLQASRAVLRRFQDEFGDVPLGAHQIVRVRDYHGAVLRRVVYRRRVSADRPYRERVRVTAAMNDLEEAGFRGAALRTELLETLGMDPETVDVVLKEAVGVA